MESLSPFVTPSRVLVHATNVVFHENPYPAQNPWSGLPVQTWPFSSPPHRRSAKNLSVTDTFSPARVGRPLTATRCSNLVILLPRAGGTSRRPVAWPFLPSQGPQERATGKNSRPPCPGRGVKRLKSGLSFIYLLYQGNISKKAYLGVSRNAGKSGSNTAIGPPLGGRPSRLILDCLFYLWGLI
jgi:hypothetical protein